MSQTTLVEIRERPCSHPAEDVLPYWSNAQVLWEDVATTDEVPDGYHCESCDEILGWNDHDQSRLQEILEEREGFWP